MSAASPRTSRHRAVPHKPTPRQEVLRNLVELAPRLDRVRVEGLDRRQLTIPRVRLLGILAQQGPTVSAELARRLEITPRAVTALVDGLEVAGLVEREPHPTDRRAVEVNLTATGRRLMSSLRASSRRFADELFAGVSDRDLAVVRRVLGEATQNLDARSRR